MTIDKTQSHKLVLKSDIYTNSSAIESFGRFLALLFSGDEPGDDINAYESSSSCVDKRKPFAASASLSSILVFLCRDFLSRLFFEDLQDEDDDLDLLESAARPVEAPAIER